MGKPELGELRILNPREVWKSEEKDFTPWIVDNIQKLSEVIGVPFTVEQTEKKVGSYELDIYGLVEGTDACVIIENQLAETDHKHLGQLLTYAAGLDAGVIIWVATQVTDEHRAAIEWLNRNTNDNVSFFLVRPEVLKIDESKPAPRFILEASPSEFKRILREAVGTDEAPRHEFRRKFWADLLAFLASRGQDWAEGRRTTKEAWISTAIGKSGIGVNISMAMGSRMRVEIYCSHDSDKRLHKQLLSHKAEIESALAGEQVSWEPLEDSAASRVAVYRSYNKEEVSDNTPERTDLFAWIEEQVVKFREIAKKYL